MLIFFIIMLYSYYGNNEQLAGIFEIVIIVY